jgi:signal transduction histidine kinase
MLTQLAGPGMTVAVQTSATILPATIDVGQLEMALINLVRNAADAAGGSGCITVSTRAVAAGPDGLPDRPAVEIAVADTGSGMSPALLARITEPFFTTKEKGKGTGLGLSMVQGFVGQAGGVMRIDSTEGQGTTIRLLFPRAPD